MNVMLVCLAGDVFLGSVDITGNKKMMAYIAQQIKDYIEEVSAQNVAQIYMDNASAMTGAINDILEVYPHIYKQRCCAHILDLLLEDWKKKTNGEECHLESKPRLCLYAEPSCNNGTFRRFSPKLSLKIPAEARLLCNYFMISHLLQVK